MEQREEERSERSGRGHFGRPEQVSEVGMQVPSAHWNWESERQEGETGGRRVRRSTVGYGKNGSILGKWFKGFP